MKKVTWYSLLKNAFIETGDDFDKMSSTLTHEELHQEFDASYYSGKQGKPFTAWGNKYVYFPLIYNNEEWVGYAPRFICNVITSHLGGY